MALYGIRGLMLPTGEEEIQAKLFLSFLRCVQTQKSQGKLVISPEKYLCVV